MGTTMRLVVTGLTIVLLPVLCYADKKDIQISYYSSLSMVCTDNDTNIPSNTIIYWITNNVVVISNNTPEQELPDRLQISTNGNALNISKIDDNQFGYYTCVMVFPNRTIDVRRWGVNIDGADFSDLEKEYRNNAIVGGIAAAVMVVMFGGGCLVWHFRYRKRSKEIHKEGIEEEPGKSEKKYDNKAFDMPNDIEMQEAREDLDTGYDNAGKPDRDGKPNGGTNDKKM